MKHLPKKIFKFLFFFWVLNIYSCSSISELYIIRENNKWGYIDKHGRQVIEPVYDYCCIQRLEDTCCSRIIWPNGLGIVKLNNKYGAIDIKGQTKIKAQYDFLDQYHNSLIIAKSNGKYGILSTNGDTIFPFIFDNQFISCNNTVGHGQINGKYYLLDFKNKTKAATDFDKITYFVEGFAAVMKDDKYGFINKSGEIAIDPKFQEIWPFNKGLAAAKIDYQWGFIDTAGEFIIEPQFDDTQGFDLFTGETAIVVKNRKYGTIDRRGNYLIKPKYEYLYQDDKKVLSATIYQGEERKTGLLRLNEKWLKKPTSENFEYFNGFIKLKKNDKYGMYRLKNNKMILPCVFEDIAFLSFGLTMLTYLDQASGYQYFAYANKKGKIVWVEKGLDIRVLEE